MSPESEEQSRGPRTGWYVATLWALLFLALVCPLTALAGEPPARLTGEGFSGGAALGRSVLGLIVVLALMFGLAWFVRRFGNAGQARGRAIQVLSALPVGGRERVLLVRVGDEQVLIGVAPGRVQALHVLERPVENINAVDATVTDDSFAGRLRAALGARQ